MQDSPRPNRSERAVGAFVEAQHPPCPRVVVENVSPRAGDGAFPLKRIIGDVVQIEADIFSDGHDVVGATLVVRRPDGGVLQIPLKPMSNDRWAASFMVTELGSWSVSISAWRDMLESWLHDVAKKQQAGQSVDVELLEIISIFRQARGTLSPGSRRDELDRLLATIGEPCVHELTPAQRVAILHQADVRELLPPDLQRRHPTHVVDVIEVWVERKKAAFSTWYELMPRSQSKVPDQHGTFDDVIARLPDLITLGFDVLYLTPIHPIGRINRKGRNNSLVAGPNDPGSPYAIGSAEGGHDAIHPQLGNLNDFLRLVASAREHGMDIALDFAIQCAPDHPWIEQHPDWFEWRPDGSIRFAENPPKRYEDIVNICFYGNAFPAAWHALRDTVLFWIDKGVTIFRVDNPHTKPFPFWRWLIREVRASHPDVIFLSEAFTRPKIMQYLAKLGFTQSYSYFTWRNTKQELTEYMLELTRGPGREFMRVNFFANTPDINPFYLQTGGRAAFQVRLFLAATLGANYGIYSGFELCDATALPGKEEYLNSEKYEIRPRDWDAPGNIRDDIRKLNMLRRGSAALQSFANLQFYNAWNDHILYYGKATPDKREFLLFAVNLDPHNPHGAHFEVPLWEFGLPDHATIEAEDLVTDRRFSWTGKVQHMWLDPTERPYAIWRLFSPAGGPNG